MEHRWGQRIPAAIPVRLVGYPDTVGSGWLWDVSISGAFILTELRPPLLSSLEIEADLSHCGGDVAERLGGWVVRRDAAGIGLEWSELAPAVLRALLGSELVQLGTSALLPGASAQGRAYAFPSTVCQSGEWSS